MTTISGAQTLLDALVHALEEARAYNKQDQESPAALLWPDEGRQWENLLPLLQDRLPIFVLGGYSPNERTGPAYWLRCVIARTIQHPDLPPGRVPVLYLPGYARQHIRALEDCPEELKPLAELQYRGVMWNQKNSRDWTISAFLQSRDGGLGIEVGADQGTKEALKRALVKLANKPIEMLHSEAPLRSIYLDGLLHPDYVRDVLRWLNDPRMYREQSTEQEWAAFAALCQSRYDFHPDRDDPVTAAERLGQRDGNWGMVWRRFAESPATYSTLPGLLRQAKPETMLPLFHHAESWPQDNETAEAALRNALGRLSNLDPVAARQAVLDLEREHARRRDWVWSSLGHAPMARAIKHLAALAKATDNMGWGTSLPENVDGYARFGWVADLAVLDSLASVEKPNDVRAVQSAVRTIYRPWLEGVAEAFQDIVAASAPDDYKAGVLPEVSCGTCLLFVDALRFDLGQRLGSLLGQQCTETEIKAALTALPTVTSTAKPAVSPAASSMRGGKGFDTVVKATGSKVNAQVLRRAIAEGGVQILGAEDLGDPTGCAWSEYGAIDAYGHEHGWRIARHGGTELGGLAERIAGLLDHGWQKVVVVTDHGWLLMPGGLPKADLPEHLTELRKGRCARLKEGSQTDQQVVPWHWNHAVRVAMAPGIHCYEAGKEYEHGGLSPQECVVPIITATRRALQSPVTITTVKWRRLRCDIAVQGSRAGARVDIRTKVGDPSTTLVTGGKEVSGDNTVVLLVEDEDREGEAALIVVVGSDGAILDRKSTIIGGQ